MRINLRVWDSSDNQFYLELYSNDPINLTKQFQDILSVNAPSGSFTQTFRVPATENNQAVFDNFEDVNSQGDFNPKRKLRAELEANTLTVLSGYVQFVACYIEKGKFPEYEIVFFGETANIFRTIGDDKLSALDLSAYDHELTYPNILSSWSGGLLSGDIRYGLMDKGRNWALDGTGRPINTTFPIYAGDWTPYIRVSALVDTILSDSGFTRSSAFLDSAYGQLLYVPLFNGQLFPVSTDESSGVDFNVGLSTDETVTTVGFHQFANLSDSGNFFDNGGDYTIGADDYWTCPYYGNFGFRAWVSGTNNDSDTDTIRIRVTKNGNVAYLSNEITVEAGDTFSQSVTFGFDLEQGDELRFGVMTYADNLGDTPDITFNSTASPNELDGTGWKMVSNTSAFEGVDVDTQANTPDIKQKDFLSGLQKMFNLVFVPDENDSTKILIEPFQDYKGTGETLDWTNLIDYDKSVKIEPTTSIQKREYEWTYSEDKDIVNQFYKDNADRIYGRFEIEDVENDFATGKETIKNPFGAYPCAYINGSNIVIHKAFDNNGQIITDPKCKVVYWGGLIDSVDLIARNDATDSNVLITQYPYFGHYSNPVATVNGEDLNYGSETPLHNIEGNPNNNLYNKYWLEYVNELYSVEARKMTAFFNLDLVTYYSLGFDDLIFIKDSYWRVLKVNQFQPNLDELTQVELIKILDTPRACEYIPDTILIGGLVQFLDSAGSTSFGSQECCEYWGYVWNLGNSRCYVEQSGGFIERIATSPNALQGANTRNLSFGVNSVGTGSNNGLTVGQNNDTGLENFYSAMVGRNNSAEDEVGIYQAFGQDVNVWQSGFHLGGAKIAIQGDKQSGVIILGYTGAMSGTITLFPYLDIPNNSTLAIDMNYCLSEWNVATSRIISEHNLSATTVMTKDASGTSFITPVIIKDVGTTGSGHYTPNIDNTTDATQHRIQLTKSGGALSNNVNVVCRIEYTMTRH